MNENATSNGGGEKGSLMENEHVKELFAILRDNEKDTSGLTAIISHVNGMEDFVKHAEDRIADMKAQLDTMKEMQDHPIKTKLQKTIAALESKVAEIKEQISELKANIIEGCKNAVTAFKEKGAVVLDKLVSFFHIKDALQGIKNNTVQVADNCDKAIANIETFSKQYHTAGRAFKNMARIAVGRKPLDKVKESGNLAKVVSVPYKAEKAIQLGIRKQVNKMIAALDRLGQDVETKRAEKAADKPQKPTLIERLEANKNKIKERELETPPKERARTLGLEV
jgi:hypothetical protein